MPTAHGRNATAHECNADGAWGQCDGALGSASLLPGRCDRARERLHLGWHNEVAPSLTFALHERDVLALIPHPDVNPSVAGPIDQRGGTSQQKSERGEQPASRLDEKPS